MHHFLLILMYHLLILELDVILLDLLLFLYYLLLFWERRLVHDHLVYVGGWGLGSLWLLHFLEGKFLPYWLLPLLWQLLEANDRRWYG